MINWDVSKQSLELISAIVKRVKHTNTEVAKRKQGLLVMDINACHVTCPLDLKGLLEADTQDFIHDINGIVCNLDRVTGKLIPPFVPRYALDQG